MRREILILLMLQIAHCVSAASTQLSEPERGAVYVIQEEAREFALETRKDVCVEFRTDAEMRGRSVLAALHEQGFAFHDGSWCNHGPRGVSIFIESNNKQTSTSVHEFVASVGDNDPIRVYGDHFATLLRKSKYVVRCDAGSEPVLIAYELLCCDKNARKTQAPATKP